MQQTMRQQMTIMLLLAASISLVLASGASSAAHAATCAVTSLSDTGNGSGGNLGFGDLRYCINRANASPGADVIQFAVSGTVTLQSSGLPNITDSVTIIGTGQTTTVVRAQATPTFERRVFQIIAGAGVTVNINNLTVTGGFLQTANGGGIGVGNGATVNLTNVTIENNQARTGGGIAAIDSTLNIVNSRIVGNRASVTDSSANGGGGIYVRRTTFTMTGSTVDGNRAESPGDISLGGGLWIGDGNATRIENSTISNNVTIGFGGGIANENTWLRMSNVTVSGNYAYFGGSGLYFSSGTSTLRNCTIAHNTVNNQAPANFRSGIVVDSNTILRIANTIAAANSTSIGGEGYSIINFGTVTRLGVNIVRFGVVNEGRGTTNGGGTVLDVEPNLQSLADNGGTVRTHRLSLNSPAVNAGANSEARDTNDPPQPLTTDARGAGFARIVGNTVDIGAFEVSPVEYLAPSSITIIGESVSPANNAPDPGETVSVAVALQNYGTTNSGDNVTVTLLPSGITNPSGAQNYGTLFVNGAPVTRSFSFTVPASAAFGSQITLTFQVQDGVNSATFTQTYTIAAPALVNGQVTIAGENFSPANNAPDPGETVTVSVPLRNNGSGNSGANVTVTLQPTGDITEPSGAQNYGTITPNGTAARTFTFKVSSSAVCGNSITLTFQAQDGASSFTFAQSFALGTPALTVSENFDQVTAPALPAGWTSTRGEAGTGWTTVTTTPASQPNAAFAGTPDSIGLSNLESPAWNVTSVNARLDFKINYDIQNSNDGAVLEIKIGAGEYRDILEAGGSFTAGGYSGQLYYGPGDTNPLGGGRSAWMGNSNGYVSSSVILPAAANGQTVRFRWVMGSDEGTGATGVQLDDVRLFGASNCSLPSCAAITLSPATLPAGQAGQSYSQTITAAGGSGPYTFTLSAGSLPGNLTLAPSGLLAGAPTGFGTFNFTVRATDANGCTGTRAYTLTISPPCSNITVNPATLPGGVVGTAYNQILTAAGGTAPYAFAVTSGTLPNNLTLAAGGTLSGTPSAAGSFTFTITATDANNCTGSRAYTVTIICPTITVNPSTLPNGTVGTFYSQTISTSGVGGSVTFAVTAGSLPGDLTLSASGVLSGTPSGSSTFTFTVTATDANNCVGSRAYTVTSAPAAAVTRMVDNTSDDATKTACTAAENDCSLRGAIAASAAGDRVEFASPLFDASQTITLSDAAGFQTLVINKDLTITGKGANLLTVRRSPQAARSFRIFQIASGATVNISGLTVTGGSVIGDGGGIVNNGTLTLSGVHVTGNNANSGGGIYNENATLNLVASTVSDNTASNGGGIGSGGGTLRVINSTISGNRATASSGGGGGASVGGIATNNTNVAITNSTITNNEASAGGGGINLFNSPASIGNTIIAANRASSDLFTNGTLTSQGYNLVGSGTVSGFNQPTDQTNVADPRLDRLDNYGGTMPSHRLQPNSPAIDRGKNLADDPNTGARIASDQRGFTRPVDLDNAQYPNATGGDGSDIGSFEAASVSCVEITARVGGGGLVRPGQAATVTVTIAGGTGPYTITLSNNGGTQSGNGPVFNFSVSPSATTTYSVAEAIDGNDCPIIHSGSATVTVDATPPTIACPANQTGVIAGTSGPVTYPAPTVSDNHPGATVTCTPASGANFALGVTTVNCTARDRAGNTAACSFTVTVRQVRPAIKDLIKQVQALVPPLTQAGQLISQLELANTRVERGQTAQACTHLQTFVSRVNSFVSERQLTTAQGQALISYANQIRSALGCAGG